jgi:hypothetical protein
VSRGALIGVTVGLPRAFPRSKFRIAATATSSTIAAAKPSGSQLRLSFSADGIKPGPVLTGEILLLSSKKFPVFPCFEEYIRT